MQMDKGEILRNYQSAKYPNEQIKVLAELNAVPKQTIVDILIEQGVDAKKLPCSKKKNAQSNTSVIDHIEILMTALQQYRTSIMDELERHVNAADAKCRQIEAALEFIKESVRG